MRRMVYRECGKEVGGKVEEGVEEMAGIERLVYFNITSDLHRLDSSTSLRNCVIRLHNLTWFWNSSLVVSSLISFRICADLIDLRHCGLSLSIYY